jgi:hypothetical protein
MLQRFNPETKKTYAYKENAIKAAEAAYGKHNLRYLVMENDEGRWVPIFIGQAAVQAGVHFHFTVIG